MLSVVVPTYNRLESLKRTISGLARQTYPAECFEAIVVSDGSTDGTHEWLVQHKAPFSLRWLAQANAGPAAARNRGIREATGDVVVFLDDDVEPVGQFLARHVRHHKLDPKVAVVGPMSPDPAMRGVEPVWIAWEHAKLEAIYGVLRPGGRYHGQAWSHHFYSGNASVRKEWLIAVGGFDETFTRQEDVQLAERMEKEHGLRFIFDETADGIHRPRRTFDSWLRVPGAYGTLDAERIKRGLLTWDTVREQAAARNGLTRLLTRGVLACPPLMSLATPALRASAVGLYRVGFARLALAALSALYNARYMQAITRALGGRQSGRQQTGGTPVPQ